MLGFVCITYGVASSAVKYFVKEDERVKVDNY
jgi:hypothetical protein